MSQHLTEDLEHSVHDVHAQRRLPTLELRNDPRADTGKFAELPLSHFVRPAPARTN